MLITSYHENLKKLLFKFIDEAINIYRNLDKYSLERANLFGQDKLEYFFDFENKELLKYFNIIGIEFFVSNEYEDYLFLSQVYHYRYNFKDVNKYIKRDDCAFKLIVSNGNNNIIDLRQFIYFDLLDKYNFCGIKQYEFNDISNSYEFIEELSYYTILGIHDPNDEYYWDYDWEYEDEYFQLWEDEELNNLYDRFYNKLDYRRKKHIEYNKFIRKNKLLNKKYIA